MKCHILNSKIYLNIDKKCHKPYGTFLSGNEVFAKNRYFTHFQEEKQRKIWLRDDLFGGLNSNRRIGEKDE